MPKDQHYSEDEEFRRAIRAEIEQRDQELIKARRKKINQKLRDEKAEIKRRIYLEEKRKYYQNRAGYREVVDEDGETDWIPEGAEEDELLYDENINVPSDIRSWKKVFYVVAVLFIAIIGGALYLILHEGKGTIHVTCNVPQARIILNAAPTEYFTDATIEQIPAGQHLITVEKPGFTIDGEMIQKINLKSGEDKVINFILVAIDESDAAIIKARKAKELEES